MEETQEKPVGDRNEEKDVSCELNDVADVLVFLLWNEILSPAKGKKGKNQGATFLASSLLIDLWFCLSEYSRYASVVPSMSIMCPLIVLILLSDLSTRRHETKLIGEYDMGYDRSIYVYVNKFVVHLLSQYA